MKILWISNVLFPEVCDYLGLRRGVVGGWLHSGATALMELNEEFDFSVAAPYDGRKLIKKKIGKINYYLIPRLNSRNSYDSRLEIYWKDVVKLAEPDVVHLHGTEFSHGFAYIKANGAHNCVVSIQGLVSVYEKYYMGGISPIDIFRSLSIRDIVRVDSLINQKSKMKLRGCVEVEILKNIKNVIGRTFWDKSHSLAINNNIKYFHCNETLRDAFYLKKWNINGCDKYSIFVSQAYYPIKGFHKLLEAFVGVKKIFPSAKLKVAGHDFINKSKWKIGGYGVYVRNFIKNQNLIDSVEFLGELNESQMVDEYLRSNIFVCPSAVENSPNSVGEAQLLGVPCIASYVGGIPDMVLDNVSGLLYDFSDAEVLAAKIIELFSDKSLAEKLSCGGVLSARARHDRVANARRLSDIYREIAGK